MVNQNPLVEFDQVHKSFGQVEVLHGVSFSLQPAEILGLVGENGSGKSTSMNLLGGIHQPSGGQLRMNGQPYRPQTPADAGLAGITFIHQELNLFDNLSIAENLFVDNFPRIHSWVPWIDRPEMRRQTRQVLDRLGLCHSPDTMVGRLSPGERQLVEIAKSLLGEPRLIILDEPTSSLTQQECQRLFDVMRQLQQQGIAMIYISHLLQDVLDLSDHVVVLRDGTVAGSGKAKNLSVNEVVKLMVGRNIDQLFPQRTVSVHEKVVLEVQGLSEPGIIQDVSLTIHSGEIVGIAGLMGSGRTELARTLFGLDSFVNGTVAIDGQTMVHLSPEKCSQQGMALLTEDRRSEGLLMPQSILANGALASLADYSSSMAGTIDQVSLDASVGSALSTVHLGEPNTTTKPVGHLSGGNQQKVVLAKWMMRSPRILLLDEPTRGVDIGAKSEIYKTINDLVQSGSGILMISSELEELTGMCDRILVMRRGEIVGEFACEEFCAEAIMRLAIWQRQEENDQ